MKTYTQACRERAENVSCAAVHVVAHNDVPELCRRLDRAIEALRDFLPDSTQANAIADELERV